MYAQPYAIETEDALATIVELAGYYLALPAVRCTITDALINTKIKVSTLMYINFKY
jgi:hypothetical protein